MLLLQGMLTCSTAKLSNRVLITTPTSAALITIWCCLQVENEFGFIGPNEKYLRHLVGTVRASVGDDVLIYTTDPPPNIAKGTIPGHEVYRCYPPSFHLVYILSHLSSWLLQG